MAYHSPRTIDEALSALGVPGSRILAGGTDFFAAQGERPIDFDIVDLTRVAPLRGITVTADGCRIGAATTWTDIVRTPLPAVFDGLKAAAREVGSIQIQNTATIAGNICNASPAADGVPTLLALGAEVELMSADAVRQVPLGAFVTGVRETVLRPGEMVSAIHVPAYPDHARSVFLKLGARRYLVISIVMVAVVVAVDGAGDISLAHVSLGACSPVAQRLAALEAELLGVPASGAADVVADRHLAPLCAIDDVRSSAEYRHEAALELTRRALSDGCRLALAAQS